MRQKMLFFLFLSENKRDYINSKLVNAYVNRFIIEEDAECDIIKVHKFENLPDLNFPKFGLIQKSLFLCSMLLESEISLFFRELDEAAMLSGSFTDETFLSNDELCFVHFIIGISIPFEALHNCFLLARSSNSIVTFLRGSNKKFLKYEQSRLLYIDNLDGSIGNDIEMMNNTFKNANTEYNKKLFLLKRLKTSDLFMVLQCERSTMPMSFFSVGKFFYFYLAKYFEFVVFALLLEILQGFKFKYTAEKKIIFIIICVTVLFVSNIYLIWIKHVLDTIIVMSLHSILLPSFIRYFQFCFCMSVFLFYLYYSTTTLYSILISIFYSIELNDLVLYFLYIYTSYIFHCFYRLGTLFFPTSLSLIWHLCFIILFDILSFDNNFCV